jgi:hypothetical protein
VILMMERKMELIASAVMSRQAAERELPAYRDAAGRRLMRISLQHVPQSMVGLVAENDVVEVRLVNADASSVAGQNDGIRDGASAGPDMMEVQWWTA